MNDMDSLHKDLASRREGRKNIITVLTTLAGASLIALGAWFVSTLQSQALANAELNRLKVAVEQLTQSSVVITERVGVLQARVDSIAVLQAERINSIDTRLGRIENAIGSLRRPRRDE